jgi:hypothetical protein
VRSPPARTPPPAKPDRTPGHQGETSSGAMMIVWAGLRGAHRLSSDPQIS